MINPRVGVNIFCDVRPYPEGGGSVNHEFEQHIIESYTRHVTSNLTSDKVCRVINEKEY